MIGKAMAAGGADCPAIRNFLLRHDIHPIRTWGYTRAKLRWR
jgi:hypothetical protein